MESSEPTLVPEWLRCNGHGNSGGNAAHHFASTHSHSDTSLVASSARNRSSRAISDIDKPRAILDRSFSSNSRRSSSNNDSSKHPYSSFNRSVRDKEREKERSAIGDFRERDSFEPLGNGKQSLRRTNSLVSRKQVDSFVRTFASESKKIESNNHLQRNGLATRDKHVSSVPKVSFEKDFPSLGADERQVPNVVRVASPGLTVTAQGLPIGSSALIGEGWSALADVTVATGSNNSAQSIHQPLATYPASCSNSGVLNSLSGFSNTTSGVSNTDSGTSNNSSRDPKTISAPGPSSGLNMAEALIQPPPVTSSAPQLSETQRLEQLVIKKVRQLIPMTPAMPKVLNSSDKSKTKLNARFGEIGGANKIGQQPPSSSVSGVCHSPRGVPVTLDASKQSQGSKLFVLKPQWENGAPITLKDGSNPENGAGEKQTNSMLPTPAGSSAPARSSKASKAVVSSLTLATSVEKRQLSSYAKSRSDFFNSVRNKNSMMNIVASETNNSVQSPPEAKPCVSLTTASPHGSENGGSNSNEDHKFLNGEKNSVSCAEVIPDEEEAFLRSLGWEENDEEEGGLTEEEISAFFQQVMKSRPSLNLSQGGHPALSILMESHASNGCVASSPRRVN